MEIVLSRFTVEPALAARKGGKEQAAVSPDLGLSKVKCALTPAGLEFPGGEMLSWRDAETVVAENRKCFLLGEEGIRDIRAFSETTGWVRSLCPTEGAPTVLVSGFPMHRIKGTDPMRDTQAKIAALGVVRGRALDTATGLGYTAIELARTASEVVTVELDPAALEVARLNPWSRRLFDHPRIRVEQGDVAEYLESQPSGSFSAVLHDPPTIQFAGDLYSLEFYRLLKRVLSKAGRLFHYTGDPASAQGAKVTAGVVRRLGDVGFRRIERHAAAFGVTASA